MERDVDRGALREVAPVLLPVSLPTRLYETSNKIQDGVDHGQVRCSLSAQWDARTHNGKINTSFNLFI